MARNVPSSSRARFQQASEHRQYKHVKRHDRGNRISGQTKHKCLAAITKDRRLSRLHRNTVEQNFDTELRENILDEIVLPHRDAARNQQNIVIRAPADLYSKIIKIVPADPEQHGLASGSNNLRCEEYSCCCCESAPADGVFSNLHEFVTRREDRDTRLFRNLNFGFSEAGQRSDIGKLDPPA